ncbi:MAG TPA: response regulator transcription factor [Verrucomicrobiae bacterium]|nr:response regulator transcription factor [Verrucomicrobiae bacterium]
MNRSSQHFIIADDDHELRFMIKHVILREYPDAEISEAADGEEALQLYITGGADLMVIDHKIPRLNGTDLIRELRTRKAGIPLVMVSNLPEAKEEAMTAGATCFLDKKSINPNLGYFLPALLGLKKS